MNDPSRYVALVRGINVGKAKRIAMADLRKMVEDLGCRDVRTLLNSGNVVFTAEPKTALKIQARIEAGLEKRLGVAARVTVISAGELAEMIAGNRLLKFADNASRLMVTVLRDPADRKHLLALERQDWTPDALALGKRVAYAWCAQGILESKLFEAIARAARDGATSRNWATMLKLNELASKPLD